MAAGGTLVLMGNAVDLAIERFPVPVKNLKRGLTRDQHFAPGTIMRVEVDADQPARRRRGGVDVRLLQQQPVLRRRAGVRVAEGARWWRGIRT